MAKLFISHSSRNNDKAIEVRNWLAANGWDDVFLDLDPERGIVAGQRWKEALQQAAYRCEVVLALVSAEWLASGWCKSEIDAARLMGKKIIVALTGIDKSQVPLDLIDEQFLDLSGDPQAYLRLKEGLKHAGLDPLSFPLEPDRRPYPGFAYFEEQDAAVFFGRDAQIVRGLDEFRRLVRTGVTRMLVILGASGSGKSSFLRAGLWPRLKRDDRAWLPLPIIRPERAVISGTYGLAGALQQIISEARFAPGFRERGLPRNRPDIEDFIKTDDGLVTLFTALRDIGQVPGLSGENPSPPTIVLALDQGEELFNEEGRDEAERFVEILTRTLRADPRTLAILAMRSDSFPLVQAHPSLAALPKDTFTLDMMLEGSFRAVIEDPARLIQPTPLRIDPQLTEALLEEISGQDALPLLAFTLAHLYENYAADNELTLSGYNKLGRVSGVIDTAVKQALAAGVAKGELPKDAGAQLALARAAFIPHLAQVNAAGQFVRRVATFDQIPIEARPLLQAFAEQRLLIKDHRKDADGKDVDVVEVSHEALLRQPPFSEWLEEDREFLIGKQQIQNDLRDWQQAEATDKKGALLTGLKLSRMRAWLAARPQDFTPQERDFGQASIERADAEDRRKARQRRIITRASIAAAVVLACATVVAGVEWRKADTSRGQAVKAEVQAKSERDKSQVQSLAVQASRAATEVDSADDIERAGALALASIAEARYTKNVTPANAIEAASRALSLLPLQVLPQGSSVKSLAALVDGRLASGGEDGSILIWPKDGTGAPEKVSQDSAVLSLTVWDGQLVSGGSDGSIKLWPADLTGAAVVLAQGSAVKSLTVWDGRLVSGGRDGWIRIWSKDGRGVPDKLLPQGSSVNSLAVWDGRLASGGEDGSILVWPKDGKGMPEKLKQGNAVDSLAVWDGRLVGGDLDGSILIWPEDGRGMPEKLTQGSSVWSLAVLADGRLASGDYVGNIRLWLWGSGTPAVFSHGSSVWSLAVLADGRLASGGGDGNIKLWPNAKESEPRVLTQDSVATSLAIWDGRLVSGDGDGSIKLWRTDLKGAPVPLAPPSAASSQPSAIRSLVVLNDGSLASGGLDGRHGMIEIWPKGGTGVPEKLPQLSPVRSLAVLKDGRLVSGGRDGSIRIWPEDFTGSPILLLQPRAIRSQPTSVWSLAVLPDGRLASGGDDGVIEIWSNGPEETLNQYTRVLSLAAARNGLLASGGLDGKIKVWAEDFRHSWVLSQGSPVWSLVWLKDGRLASGGADGTIKIWSGPDEEVDLPQGSGVNSLALWGDDRLAAAGADGRVKLWLINKNELIADLCELRAGRNLSPGATGEWVEYIPDHPWQPSCDALGFQHSSWRTVAAPPDRTVAFYTSPAAARPAALPVFSPSAVPPASEKTSPTPVARKDPFPRPGHHPKDFTHTASKGNIATPTADKTAQLNRQELTRLTSVAEKPQNGIFNLFRSPFHYLKIQPIFH